MGKNMLLLLMLLVTLLTGATLAVSIYAFKAQESLTDSMLSSYVSDIAESFAENSHHGGPDAWQSWWERGERSFHSDTKTWRGRWRGNDEFRLARNWLFFMMFAAPSSPHSGGILLLDRDGRVIGGSMSSGNLSSLWREGMTSGAPTDVEDDGGTLYRVVVRELPSGNYVLVAASKTGILKSISQVWNVWLLFVMASSSTVLVGIAALWKFLVLPIRDIVETIGGTRWGSGALKFRHSPLYEVDALSRVIEKSASDAVTEEQLRLRYISDIVQAQEDAGRRLARELHDGPLQSVVAAIKRVQLAQMAQSSSGDHGARERLDEAERISQYAANEIRDYCDKLSPSWLSLGVSSALEEMAERLSGLYDVNINLYADGDFDSLELPDEYALSIIRILQEAVSNSVRHGGAESVNATLEMKGDELVFTVSDNGSGFKSAVPDYAKLRLEGHRGLSNMYERVQLLGGVLEITSADGGGCVILAKMPVPSQIVHCGVSYAPRQ
jgi:signal transduction histidine kinase